MAQVSITIDTDNMKRLLLETGEKLWAAEKALAALHTALNEVQTTLIAKMPPGSGVEPLSGGDKPPSGP